MALQVRSPLGGLKAVVFTLLLAGLAACGGSQTATTADEDADATVLVARSPADQVAARKREEARRKAREAETQDFAYFRYRIDTSTEQPLACFVFSAALDPQADYSPYVEFRPSFRAALTVEGR
ncbi:MAG: hypothetical protein ACK4Y9_11785, partial [Hyphomonas sp.]